MASRCGAGHRRFDRCRVLLIDNYDSFTYNVVHELQKLGASVIVHRNDAITVDECVAAEPTHVVISPGPCTPAEAGISVAAVHAFAGRVPLLGVCLGHECIVAAYGAPIRSAGEFMHGKASRIRHDGAGVYTGIPDEFRAIRYHSLAVLPSEVPSELVVTSVSETNVVMGVRHRELRVEGVQYHPESFMSEYGAEHFANFLSWSDGSWSAEERRRFGLSTVE